MSVPPTVLRFALAALLLWPAGARAGDGAEVLATAEAAFAEGVSLRDDSDRARPAFARAASAYDQLWAAGHRSPALALNRSRAHRLAGDLPRAIAALHDGLAVARFARAIQTELDDARARVLLPTEGPLAIQTRPRATPTVGSRMSPADAWALAGLGGLLACLGVARFAMTRNWVWLVAAAVCAAGLVALGVLWLQDSNERARSEALPLRVLTRDVLLRSGNAVEYPARAEPALPKGCEVRELSRRGGWVQVRLPGGLTGWVPDGATVRCGP